MSLLSNNERGDEARSSSSQSEDDEAQEKGPSSPAFNVLAERAGTKHIIAVELNQTIVHLHKFDLASESQRSKFAKTVSAKCPSIPASAIEAELLRIALEHTREVPHAGPAPTAGAPSEPSAQVLAEVDAILADPELIDRVCDDVAALGVAGERELALTVYLIGVSRLLPRPLAGIVRGPSSSGKSYLIERVAQLFPSEDLILATQMTPQALFHMPPGSLRHKWVVAGERSRVQDDDRAEATRALREMLSSGNLTKLMPVKVEGGRIETATIKQEGPIAFIESTTLSTIFEEDANRCLLLGTDERPEQTRRIISEVATRLGVSLNGSKSQVIASHQALQRALPRSEVRVPFAPKISERFVVERVEVRRAFPQLLAMIQASALLHYRQREITADGVILANAVDFQIARRLCSKAFAISLGGGVSDPALRFFEKLKASVIGEFTSRDAVRLGLAGKSSVYSWLSELHDAGAIEQVEPPKGRKPAKWKLTGTDPADGASIIPSEHDIFPEHRKHGHETEATS